jgi:predicted DNA-binding helix-hairpin-helix protein
MSFDPVPDTPLSHQGSSPLWREMRLYQVSYLMKDYGVRAKDLDPALDDKGFLLDQDPKMAMALASHDVFPVDVNNASLNELMMVPGIGPSSANRIMKSRPIESLVQLALIGVVVKRARPFIVVGGRMQTRLEAFV